MGDRAAPTRTAGLASHDAGLRAWRQAMPHARLGDERLARLVAQGREDAFAELYERHHQALYRYCRSILRNGEEAQDALQSAMERAFVALRKHERDLAVRPWLFRIAHNEAITLLRRRRSQDLGNQRLAQEELALQSAGPEIALERRERIATLLADLATLAERQRAALLMRELSGLSIEEIAGALSTTPGAAKQALFEARSALKELAEGRAVECDSIRRLIGEHDGRVLRGRLVRAHLRACPSCREFEQAIAARSADLRAIVPPLPAIAAATILTRLLAASGLPHGATAGAATAAGAASGAASVPATGTGTAGAIAGGGATSAGAGAATAASGVTATAGGVAGLGASVAAKLGVTAAIVALAAGGAVHVLTGSDRGTGPNGAQRAGDAHSAGGNGTAVTSSNGERGGSASAGHSQATRATSARGGPAGTKAMAARGAHARATARGGQAGPRARPGQARTNPPAIEHGRHASHRVQSGRRGRNTAGEQHGGAGTRSTTGARSGSSHAIHARAKAHSGGGKSLPGAKTGAPGKPTSRAQQRNGETSTRTSLTTTSASTGAGEGARPASGAEHAG